MLYIHIDTNIHFHLNTSSIAFPSVPYKCMTSFTASPCHQQQNGQNLGKDQVIVFTHSFRCLSAYTITVACILRTVCVVVIATATSRHQSDTQKMVINALKYVHTQMDDMCSKFPKAVTHSVIRDVGLYLDCVIVLTMLPATCIHDS